jgi:hypothetical protein
MDLEFSLFPLHRETNQKINILFYILYDVL